jgi:uncharacterized protein (UPF0262 family)
MVVFDISDLNCTIDHSTLPLFAGDIELPDLSGHAIINVSVSKANMNKVFYFQSRDSCGNDLELTDLTDASETDLKFAFSVSDWSPPIKSENKTQRKKFISRLLRGLFGEGAVSLEDVDIFSNEMELDDSIESHIKSTQGAQRKNLLDKSELHGSFLMPNEERDLDRGEILHHCNVGTNSIGAITNLLLRESAKVANDPNSNDPEAFKRQFVKNEPLAHNWRTFKFIKGDVIQFIVTLTQDSKKLPNWAPKSNEYYSTNYLIKLNVGDNDSDWSEIDDLSLNELLESHEEGFLDVLGADIEVRKAAHAAAVADVSAATLAVAAAAAAVAAADVSLSTVRADPTFDLSTSARATAYSTAVKATIEAKKSLSDAKDIRDDAFTQLNTATGAKNVEGGKLSNLEDEVVAARTNLDSLEKKLLDASASIPGKEALKATYEVEKMLADASFNTARDEYMTAHNSFVVADDAVRAADVNVRLAIADLSAVVDIDYVRAVEITELSFNIAVNNLKNAQSNYQLRVADLSAADVSFNLATENLAAAQAALAVDPSAVVLQDELIAAEQAYDDASSNLVTAQAKLSDAYMGPDHPAYSEHVEATTARKDAIDDILDISAAFATLITAFQTAAADATAAREVANPLSIAAGAAGKVEKDAKAARDKIVGDIEKVTKNIKDLEGQIGELETAIEDTNIELTDFTNQRDQQTVSYESAVQDFSAAQTSYETAVTKLVDASGALDIAIIAEEKAEEAYYGMVGDKTQNEKVASQNLEDAQGAETKANEALVNAKNHRDALFVKLEQVLQEKDANEKPAPPEEPSGDEPSGDEPSGDEPSGDEPSGDEPPVPP